MSIRRARQLDVPFSPNLSRSEMAFAGVPEREMPFLRDYARAHFPAFYWLEQEALERQRVLFELLADYARGVARLDPKRGEALTKGVDYARGQWKAALRRLEAKQVRRLPTRPDPMQTGGTPTDEAGRAITGQRRAGPEREMIRQAHRNERPTQGEERWDPKWGNPNTELPAPVPQGMRRLPPTKDVEIPPNPRRTEGGVPPVKPKARRENRRLEAPDRPA